MKSLERTEQVRWLEYDIWYESHGQEGEAGNVISGSAVRKLEYHDKELNLEPRKVFKTWNEIML